MYPEWFLLTVINNNDVEMFNNADLKPLGGAEVGVASALVEDDL